MTAIFPGETGSSLGTGLRFCSFVCTRGDRGDDDDTIDGDETCGTAFEWTCLAGSEQWERHGVALPFGHASCVVAVSTR